MHNLLAPFYARKQAKQRWRYSLVACACMVLAVIQFQQALRPAPTTVSLAVNSEQTTLPAPIHTPPKPIIATPSSATPAASAENSNTAEVGLNSALTDPCAGLEVPNKQISAVLWQPQGSKLILRASSGKHINITIGETLKNSEWVLQRIDKLSITWLHQRRFCRAKQAL